MFDRLWLEDLGRKSSAEDRDRRSARRPVGRGRGCARDTQMPFGAEVLGAERGALPALGPAARHDCASWWRRLASALPLVATGKGGIA